MNEEQKRLLENIRNSLIDGIPPLKFEDWEKEFNENFPDLKTPYFVVNENLDHKLKSFISKVAAFSYWAARQEERERIIELIQDTKFREDTGIMYRKGWTGAQNALLYLLKDNPQNP